MIMYLRKYHFLVLLLFAFIVTYAVMPSHRTDAQTSHIIGLQPTTGTAGTTVTISDISGTNAGKPCSVSGPYGTQNIGVIQGGVLTYVIPTQSAAGAVFSFSCSGSAPGSATNTVSFTVILLLVIVSPVPVDSDGDGTVDSGDQCPNQAGPRENRGCPVQQVDSDGDGIPDNVDACPSQAGIPEANGCAPSPAPQLPALPVDGPCVLATLEAGTVNIRQGTSTDTPVVGQLDPLQIYSVIGRNADGSWMQINGGWVASFVVRQGGDCSSLSQTDGVAVPDPVIAQPQEPVGLLVPAVQKVRDAAARMGNCPEYMPAVDALPTFLALYIVGDADPCAAAAAEMDDLFLNPGVQAASPIPPDVCPEGFPGANAMIPEFNSLLYNVPPATAEYLSSLADISESPSLFCTLLMDLSGGFITEFTFPADEHVLPVAYVWCDAQGSYQEALAAKLQAIAVAPQYLRNLNGDCALFHDLHVLGSVSSGNVQFFDVLVQNCAVSAEDAGHRAFSDAVRGAFDASAAANQGCAGFQVLTSYPLPPDLQPLLPQIAALNADCTGNFRVLATHNSQLGAETLYRILKSVDPCGAAHAFAQDGDIPMNVVPPPDCIQGNQLTLQGAAQFNQVILDASSSWFQKITALDRPLDQLCTLPAQLGVGGDFAAVPTATMGALVANPTATLPVFVALPTATLPQFAANPTEVELPEGAFPEDDQGEQPPPEGEEPPPAEEPEAPAEPTEDPAGQEQPPASDGQSVPPAQGGECFGCLPTDPLIPGGRLEALVVASNPEGGFDGLLAAPSLRTLPSPEAGAVATAGRELIQLPLENLPTPLDGFPAILWSDGTTIGYFSRGVDPATTSADVHQLVVTLPDGSGSPPAADQAVTWTAIALAESGESLQMVLNLQFPAGLSPAPYAPAWAAEGSLLLMSLTDSVGITSIYMLPLAGEGGTVTPQLVVQNAFAPTIAPNGRYLAFERTDATGRNIYALALNSLLENPITQQTPGSECYGARFGMNSLTVYFTCRAGDQAQMYRYGLSGITPINTNIPNAGNPSPSDIEGYILFDDGSIVYLSTEDGSGPQPYYEYKLRSVRITSYSVSGPID
jgi:hypothetical protein